MFGLEASEPAKKSLKMIGDSIPENQLDILAHGCLSADHAPLFKAFLKQKKTGLICVSKSKSA